MLRNLKPWPRGGKIFLDPLVSSAFILRAPPPLQSTHTASTKHIPITHNFTSGYTPHLYLFTRSKASCTDIHTYTFVRPGTHNIFHICIFSIYSKYVATHLSNSKRLALIRQNNITPSELLALFYGLLNGACECVYLLCSV